MKRGRKPLATPTVEWKCRVPIDVAAKIDLFLHDPIRNQVEYGKRSQFVTALLRDWLQAHSQLPALDGLHTLQKEIQNA